MRLEEIVPTEEQIRTLFELLSARQHSISHRALPAFETHADFVRNHPYRVWYLIQNGDVHLGSVYLSQDNSIGLNIAEESQIDTVRDIIAAVTAANAPLPPIPSVRAGHFFINVPATNHHLARQLEEIGYAALQTSYDLSASVGPVP